MNLYELQQDVDDWIKEYGVRYFDERTNMLVLMEEVGELARLMSRKYGEQSFKDHSESEFVDRNISEELGDCLFVLVCLANQMGLNLEEIMKSNLQKKTCRDKDRHHNNPKLE